jgi:hypothetical protein
MSPTSTRLPSPSSRRPKTSAQPNRWRRVARPPSGRWPTSQRTSPPQRSRSRRVPGQDPRGSPAHHWRGSRQRRIGRVAMTTRLAGKATRFLPFNKGHNRGAGNPLNPTGHRTAYLWERRSGLTTPIAGRRFGTSPARHDRARTFRRFSCCAHDHGHDSAKVESEMRVRPGGSTGLVVRNGPSSAPVGPSGGLS